MDHSSHTSWACTPEKMTHELCVTNKKRISGMDVNPQLVGIEGNPTAILDPSITVPPFSLEHYNRQ